MTWIFSARILAPMLPFQKGGINGCNNIFSFSNTPSSGLHLSVEWQVDGARPALRLNLFQLPSHRCHFILVTSRISSAIDHLLLRTSSLHRRKRCIQLWQDVQVDASETRGDGDVYWKCPRVNLDPPAWVVLYAKKTAFLTTSSWGACVDNRLAAYACSEFLAVCN